jgi:hypothetical protein
VQGLMRTDYDARLRGIATAARCIACKACGETVHMEELF